MTIKRFEDVIAWQRGRYLNQELFQLFQDNRNYSFKDQLFRAGLSITNNIAEGFERGSMKELRQFLVIARGSNAEVRSMLYTALDTEYITRTQFEFLLLLNQEIGKLLTSFIRSINPAKNTTARA